MKNITLIALNVALLLAPATLASAQDMPADYQAVMTILGRTGDFKDAGLKVNIPRGDLRVTIGKAAGRDLPALFRAGPRREARAGGPAAVNLTK